MNEAAINAAKSNREYIKNDDIKNAFVKVGIGVEKKKPYHIRNKKKRLLHIMNQDMQFFSMYSLMWDQYTQSLLFQQEWEQQDIQCRFLRRMRCLIPKGKMLQNIIVSLVPPPHPGQAQRRKTVSPGMRKAHKAVIPVGAFRLRLSRA